MTQRDRQRIATGIARGLSYAEIARRLDRPTSTVSREVGRNGGPRDYRPERAHQTAVRRARRGTPAPPRPAGPPVDTAEREIVELAVRSGMPRITARVHVDLLLSEDGRRTAAELVRRLRVSPASVSVAVNFLVDQGYVRRERDARRRDVYVVDDDAWYRSIEISARRTMEAVRHSMAGVAALGAGTAAGRRLARTGTFLERVTTDLLESAAHWRPLLTDDPSPCRTDRLGTPDEQDRPPVAGPPSPG